MVRESAAFGGRGVLHALSAILFCAFVCACSSVSNVEIRKLVPNPPKVSTLLVRYQDVGTVYERVTGWAYGPRGTVPPSPAMVKPGADRNTGIFNKLLAASFRDRFPGIAQAYGVTVSPTASTILMVQLANTASTCPSADSCGTTALVLGTVMSSGKFLWSIQAMLGPISQYSLAEKNDAMFDMMARKWLEAMKKEGLIN
jgi:hypothetical protein